MCIRDRNNNVLFDFSSKKRLGFLEINKKTNLQVNFLMDITSNYKKFRLFEVKNIDKYYTCLLYTSGQGSAFTGMMRQLGGSFGVAAITTFISNRNMLYRSDLVSKLDSNSLMVQQRIAGLKASFIAKGMTPDQALASAYKILDFSVMKQAAVLSYICLLYTSRCV